MNIPQHLDITDQELSEAAHTIIQSLLKVTKPRIIFRSPDHQRTYASLRISKPVTLSQYISLANALSISPGTLLDLAIAHAAQSPQAQHRNA